MDDILICYVHGLMKYRSVQVHFYGTLSHQFGEGGREGGRMQHFLVVGHLMNRAM